jgi:hypothetical protein
VNLPDEKAWLNLVPCGLNLLFGMVYRVYGKERPYFRTLGQVDVTRSLKMHIQANSLGRNRSRHLSGKQQFERAMEYLNDQFSTSA